MQVVDQFELKRWSMGYVTQHPFLGLLSWYPVMWSSLCNSFQDQAPVDFIYGCLIFKWVAVSWFLDRALGKYPSNVLQVDMYYFLFLCLWWFMQHGVNVVCVITTLSYIIEQGQLVMENQWEQQSPVVTWVSQNLPWIPGDIHAVW